jgi:hypothetical protein
MQQTDTHFGHIALRSSKNETDRQKLQNTHFIFFSFENPAVCEVMWRKYGNVTWR